MAICSVRHAKNDHESAYRSWYQNKGKCIKTLALHPRMFTHTIFIFFCEQQITHCYFESLECRKRHLITSATEMYSGRQTPSSAKCKRRLDIENTFLWLKNQELNSLSLRTKYDFLRLTELQRYHVSHALLNTEFHLVKFIFRLTRAVVHSTLQILTNFWGEYLELYIKTNAKQLLQRDDK